MILDLVYLIALFALSPWLAWRAARTGRYRAGLSAKLFGRVTVRNPDKRPVAWFHAVSVGEVNLLGTLVPAFRRAHPGWHVVVSATTDTGLAEARKRFADADVIAWPFDFTWAVRRALRTVNPALVVLTESELWPNFLAAARQSGVPVVVANARMSPRSYRRLRRFAGVARRLLYRNVSAFAVQEAEYAERLVGLGVPREKVIVTGSIKYDGALKPRDTPATAALRLALGTACVVRPTPPGPPSLKGRGESRLAALDESELVSSSQASRSDAHSPLPFREGGPGGVGRSRARNTSPHPATAQPSVMVPPSTPPCRFVHSTYSGISPASRHAVARPRSKSITHAIVHASSAMVNMCGRM
jgi:3-deoxy-D-manno-octulosonic-acid transferase